MTDPLMSPADQAALARAVEALERTSLAMRLNNLVGRQLETMGALVPASVSGVVTKASTLALKAAMRAALLSLRKTRQRDNRAMHRTLAAASGAAGGALGLASLPIELPISTTIMLRSIADIARAEGEDLSQPEAALACLQVFALGGPARAGAAAQTGARADDMFEGGYFALRGVLAKSISEAATYIAQKGLADEAAPILVRLMSQIAARFGLVVSQKVVAQAVPVIGAVSGAAINLAFTEHFQALAKGHFTVRRLERLYSPDLVRQEYQRIASEKARAAAA